MADYPILGFRGVVKFRRRTAVRHRTLVISVCVWSRCRRAAINWLRVIGIIGFKRWSLSRVLVLNSILGGQASLLSYNVRFWLIREIAERPNRWHSEAPVLEGKLCFSSTAPSTAYG